MSIKSDRQTAIKALIAKEQIANQEDLQNFLEDAGFSVTQATLSRDLKELRVVKVHDGSIGYSYRLPVEEDPVSGKTVGFTLDSVKSLEFSENIAVMKTHPGFASVVASFIDHKPVKEVVGTLAGDDTLLLILRVGYTHQQVVDALATFIEGLNDKVVNL